MYDEDFVIAQIDATVKTINAIRQRGRPRKIPKLESQDDSKPSDSDTHIIRSSLNFVNQFFHKIFRSSI